MTPGSSYADWKAPAQDGELLIWPQPAAIIEQTRLNQKHFLASHARIQNVPLRELRSQLRRWIGHADEQRPLIAVGHQIELIHPGVWAKDVFINELASRMDGSAYHLTVDTDAPKHLHLRWPGNAMPITDDPRLGSAAWSALLEAPTPAHLSEVESAFSKDAGGWEFQPMMQDVFASLRRLNLESTSLTWVLANAIHHLDWSLGLRHHSMLLSPLWHAPPYLAFVHHILANADAFAAQYNSILADYRRDQGIRNSGRPWPDLKVSADACEVPFWLDHLESGQRRRGAVQRQHGAWSLLIDNDALLLRVDADGLEAAEALLKFLRRHNVLLAPRALTLTGLLRMLLVDQFVHGIGGGRYDQVTDRVLHRFFGLQPPHFTVTTATLLFPSAAGRGRIDLASLEQEGRRLRHGAGVPQKQELLAQMNSLPRLSNERRRVFYEMHTLLSNLQYRPEYQDWQHRFDKARQEHGRQRDLFDRELFVAIQPRERLQGLISRYHEAFTGT